MIQTIDILQVQFRFPVLPGQAVWLKKPISAAIADLRKASKERNSEELAGIKTDLFFNRDEETGNSENRYPLIQYSSVNGLATITGINEGAESLHQMLTVLKKVENKEFNNKHLINKPNEISLLNYHRPKYSTHTVKVLRQKKQYLIRQWLPLDSERYKNFSDEPFLADLADVLNESLVRQLKKMLAGIGVERNIIFKAQTGLILKSYPLVQVYKEKKLGFDCIIHTNIDLPPGIGIGQVPGIGYGQITPFDSANFY